MPKAKKKTTRKRNPVVNRKPGLYLDDAGHKGRGVFCRTDIRRGEVLEVTPALLLGERDTTLADKSVLLNYTFAIGDGISKAQKKRARIQRVSQCSAVVMGILAFCNHGEKPNAEILWEEEGDTVYYSLRATRNIPKGTEICTTYGDSWFSERGH